MGRGGGVIRLFLHWLWNTKCDNIPIRVYRTFLHKNCFSVHHFLRIALKKSIAHEGIKLIACEVKKTIAGEAKKLNIREAKKRIPAKRKNESPQSEKIDSGGSEYIDCP